MGHMFPGVSGGNIKHKRKPNRSDEGLGEDNVV